MKDVLHLCITFIYLIIYLQHLTVFTILIGLVKDTQHLNKTVVYTTME